MTLFDPGLKRLYLAVILQAIDDLRANPQDDGLKEWLLFDGLFILEGFNQPVDPPKWERYILAGCPGRHLARHKR